MVMLTLGTGTTKTLILCAGRENSDMPTSSRHYLLTGHLQLCLSTRTPLAAEYCPSPHHPPPPHPPPQRFLYARVSYTAACYIILPGSSLLVL